MAESHIQFPPDSTGKKGRTTTVDLGGGDVHQTVLIVGDGQTGDLAGVDSVGLKVSNPKATAASPAAVVSSASNTTLLAANADRRGAMIVNGANKTLRVKFGATASATSYTVAIPSGGYFEFPQPMYAGIVDGIWEAGPAGNAYVTEVT